MAGCFWRGWPLLPPVREIHKQLILLAFGMVQLAEGWFLARIPQARRELTLF